MHPSKTSSANFPSQSNDVATTSVNIIRPSPLYTANAFAAQTRDLAKYLTDADKELLSHEDDISVHTDTTNTSTTPIVETTAPISIPKIQYIRYRPRPQTTECTHALPNSATDMSCSSKIKCVRHHPRPQIIIHTIDTANASIQNTNTSVPSTDSAKTWLPESPKPKATECKSAYTPTNISKIKSTSIQSPNFSTSTSISLESQSSTATAIPMPPAFVRSMKLLPSSNPVQATQCQTSVTKTKASVSSDQPLRPRPLNISFKGGIRILR